MKNIYKDKDLQKFGVIDYDILTNPEYSANEIRLYLFIVSLPEDWVINKTRLQKESGITKNTFLTAWSKLEEKGHIVMLGKEQRGTRFLSHIYKFYASLDQKELNEDEDTEPKESTQDSTKNTTIDGSENQTCDGSENQTCDGSKKQTLTNNKLTNKKNKQEKTSKEGKKSSYPTNLFDMIYDRYEKGSEMNKALCYYLGQCLAGGRFTVKDWEERLDFIEDMEKQKGVLTALDSIQYSVRGNGKKPYYKFYEVKDTRSDWLKEEMTRKNKTVVSKNTGIVF